MLHNIKNRKESGFTIIEVLIVLAIAGLIIAIVLFAVPALQRNGRNTAIKNDAGVIAGQISDFESNNDGAAPNAASNTNGTLKVYDSTVGTTTTPSSGKMQAGTTVASSTTTNPVSGGSLVDPTVGKINVDFKFRCDGTPSNRAAAIVYDIETSSGSSTKCQDV